eukprot:scaffold41700_cov17-Tisochrysis_lutea.AAC.4
MYLPVTCFPYAGGAAPAEVDAQPSVHQQQAVMDADGPGAAPVDAGQSDRARGKGRGFPWDATKAAAALQDVHSVKDALPFIKDLYDMTQPSFIVEVSCMLCAGRLSMTQDVRRKPRICERPAAASKLALQDEGVGTRVCACARFAWPCQVENIRGSASTMVSF